MKSIKQHVNKWQFRGGSSEPLRRRDTIAMRADRVEWEKVDDILARVPANPPLPSDEAE